MSTDQNTVPFEPSSTPAVVKTDAEWREQLSTHDYYVLREGDTEPQYRGYTSFFEEGVYECKGCQKPLYRSDAKFSGCGWPSFDDCLPNAVTTRPDPDGRRVEIICTSCQSHLGHLFTGERFTEKNVRHCVNSCCLVFNKNEEKTQ